MAALSIALTFLALSPLASPAEEDAGQPRNSLRLVWYDGEHLLPAHAFKQLTRQVDALFAPLGVELVWTHGVGREISASELASKGLELKVLLLPADPATWGLDPNVMGVVMGKATPRDVVYIFYNNVVRTLGYRPKSAVLRQPREETFLVRAVARVLAHEMVHAMAPRHPHHDDGLMSCKLTKSILVKPSLRIDPESALAFRTEFAWHAWARDAGRPGGREFLLPFPR